MDTMQWSSSNAEMSNGICISRTAPMNAREKKAGSEIAEPAHCIIRRQFRAAEFRAYVRYIYTVRLPCEVFTVGHVSTTEAQKCPSHQLHGAASRASRVLWMMFGAPLIQYEPTQAIEPFAFASSPASSYKLLFDIIKQFYPLFSYCHSASIAQAAGTRRPDLHASRPAQTPESSLTHFPDLPRARDENINTRERQALTVTEAVA
ncbi:hypothetical protein EVAR_95361_1 [Eumeta japonica]|uniref:Uncharacterized protein n=1 Tax=Eumeta variegata TaxID=151549 RepID=A0A4C1UA24_EUMVA|nr:hypothetical protein EVAR_95361_1 [Eumeta japonica]